MVICFLKIIYLPLNFRKKKNTPQAKPQNPIKERYLPTLHMIASKKFNQSKLSAKIM